MSRNRRRDLFNPRRHHPNRVPIDSDDTLTIRIVCTDRSQHHEVPFGSITMYRDQDHGWIPGEPEIDVQYVSSERINEFSQEISRTFSFPCERCRPRNVELRQETLEKICIQFANAGWSKFDISTRA